MIPVLLLADDLTGALDSTIPFAARGMSARVALTIDAIPAALAASPDVLSVDLGTRALSPAAAAARVEQAWQALGSVAPRFVMKKVDSRLKGAVAAETQAMLRLSGRRSSTICAAAPDQGRVTLAGRMTGTGIASPIDAAAQFGDIPCTHHDAADAADLRAIAATIVAAPGELLAVGARGLAEALAELLTGRSAAPAGDPAVDLPMIMAIGSRDPITAHQIEQMRRDHPSAIRDALTCRNDAPILLIREPEAEAASPSRVAKRLAEKTMAHVRAIRARTILCSGGDTAAAVMHAMGVTQLIPERELCPGVPVSRIANETSLHIVTKSGGFGKADILSRIVASSTAAQRSAAA